MSDNENSPTSIQSGVEFLMANTQAIWGEPSFKGLIKQFAAILYDHFRAESFSLVATGSHNQKLGLRRSPMKFRGLQPITDKVLADLRDSLVSLDFDGGEFGCGINPMHLEGQEYNVARVERPDSPPCVIVWKTYIAPVDAESEPGAQVRSKCLEFLVRQLQSECRWYRKLDTTQAMLYKDDLTGLYNYRYFEVALENELRRSHRFNTTFCLLFVDLDNFKKINDSHGHLSGSSVLKQVSDVIVDTMREIDIPIRYGGDEYVIVLLGTTATQGLLAAERLRQQVAGTSFKVEDGDHVNITVSIGVAAYPEHGKDKETLLKIADDSMYRSKRAGKNRVTLFEMHEKEAKKNFQFGSRSS